MIELLMMCAPQVDPVTMSAVVKQESGGNPWALNNNTTKKSQIFGTKSEAVAAALHAIRNGQSVDMGLAQLNSKNLEWLGLTVEQAFDPCANINAGAKILENGYVKTGNLHQALSMYNTGKPNSTTGSAYAQKVFNKAGVVVPAIPGGQIAQLPGTTSHILPAIKLVVIPSPFSAPLSVEKDSSQFSSSWR
jgi:type IV secretion system protein VirB1